MNIEQKLEEIIYKYNLCVNYPEWRLYYQAKKLIVELFESFPENKKVAIRGIGGHTKRVMEILEEHHLKNKISYLVDQKEDIPSNLYGIEVLSVEEAEKRDIDVYVISSFIHEWAMMTELRRKNDGVVIIGLYSYFRRKQVALSKEFYFIRPHIEYVTLFFCHEALDGACSLEEEENLIKELIFLYLEIRDFVGAFKWMDTYVKKGFNEVQKYYLAKKEIEELLIQIEECLKEDNKKDIVVNWLDNVPNRDFSKMNWLYEHCKQGLIFDYAFSPHATTRSAMMNLFKASLPQEGKSRAFHKEKVTVKNSPLLECLEKQDYKFKFIANRYTYKELFEEQDIIKFDYSFFDSGSNAEGCSTQLQWYALAERLKNNTAGLYFIHNVSETHWSYMCPTSLGTLESGTMREQETYKLLATSREYLDEQLKFYSRFYGSNAYEIYLSDHGYSGPVCTPERHQIIFSVVGNTPDKGREERIFSLHDFVKVVQYIMNPIAENYNKIFRDEIILHRLDCYGTWWINKVLSAVKSCIEEKRYSDIRLQTGGLQHCVAVTKQFMYSKPSLWREEALYVLPDTSTNCLGEEAFSEIEDRLREICEKQWIDIEKDDFFEGSREIYRLIEGVLDKI